MFVVVSYDIPDDKRRAKIADSLENYGTRVQYSVFECLLGEDKLEEMRKEITSLIDERKDSVRVYMICEMCAKRIKIHGIGEITRDQEVYVI